MQLPVLLAALLSALRAAGSVAPGSAAPGRLERWVRSGLQSLQWEQLERCLRSSSVSEAECRRLAHLPLSSVAVYASEPRNAADKVLAILPDSSSGMLSSKLRGGLGVGRMLNRGESLHRHQQPLANSMTHDAVLVLDPSPGENFGHPVVLFYVDMNVTKKRCSHLDGIYLDHAEFARCPQPLPMSSSSLPVSSCELNKNTRRCHQQPLATHLSCRLYQTCDHAVLISGGWQQQMTFQRHVQNLHRFFKMLQNNGFHKDHIKTFFASSGHVTDDIEGVYSATEKAVIRNHVSYICRKQHCADTLVLYLNSPTRNDGTMLLWDANLNGIADLKERYSVNELLTDLAGCRATRVLLFVDQSYSGVLSKRLRGSQKHLNVVLIQSQAQQTHAYQNQRLNPSWEDSSWSFISPTTCLLDHLGKASFHGAGTTYLLEPWAGLLNVTLAGAPCNVTPPLTDSEMRREYQGCQNLPTALWHQKHRRIN
ncbi:uncharacterized protein si:ch211-67e16.11 isoform X3 [Cololabis saira]|uniref:uncharacterized protein si:ch211-67e16.11 isoform X3 n=1 Tax=Cololabis saira TaxID=129043 RepID=UPI002AD53B25|nr:uncharacterized protein si:ch211-67e16.11 isoform X3 [Cololabis saira]